MPTLLAEYRNRRAAHGLHRCNLCGRKIAKREHYLDQRIADDGRVYTFRAHLACDAAWWSWDPDAELPGMLQDLTEGHLPPCRRAWADEQHEPCTCIERTAT